LHIKAMTWEGEMQEYRTFQDAGPDRLIHLAIPVDEPNRRYQVTVVVEPASTGGETSPPQGTKWPPGFLDEMYGCLNDVTLERGDQGEYEQREELS
jgi:hypothetical protein